MSIPDTRQSTPPIAQSRERLIQIVSERSLLHDTNVKLASGASSTFYFDMKRAASLRDWVGRTPSPAR